MDTPFPEYVSPRQLAKSIGRSPSYIYERVRDGRIPAVSIDGAVRITLEAAQQWMASVTKPIDKTARKAQEVESK